MKFTKILLSCAAFAALSATASAAVMTYTETGFLSGSLGGTSFTDAAVTLRVTADTANVQYSPLFAGPTLGYIPLWTNAGVMTIDIAGFGTATFNGSSVFGVGSENISAFQPGTAAVTIGDLTTLAGVLSLLQTADLNYALATETTFTGVSSTTSGTYSTTLGDLTTTGTSGNATFTAALATVPEPSALVLLGLSTMGLVARRRRLA